MKYSLEINNLAVINKKLEISITGKFIDPDISKEYLSKPKVILYFNNGIEDRRIPFVIKSEDITFMDGKCMFFGTYTYYLDLIFWKTRNAQIPFDIYFNLSFSDFYEEKVNVDLNLKQCNQDKKYYELEVGSNHYIIKKVITKSNKLLIILKLKKIFKKLKRYISKILKHLILLLKIIFKKFFFNLFYQKHLLSNLDNEIKQYKINLIKIKYKFSKYKKIQPNKITFYSVRSKKLSGNFKFVYDKIKQDKNLDVQILFNPKLLKDMTRKEINEFVNSCATSKVIVLDEFTPQIHLINLKKETKLVQLWHACGAFKTFGFSRLSKPKGSTQSTKNHRSYDYVTVSSKFCKKFHSEGFGISTENVVATGIPRTDIFFDEIYKEKVINEFYNKYPNFKNKKIILFAPTFRGNIKEDAYYPMELFNVKEICDNIGYEYAIIIKHHPFIKEKHYIPEEYSDRVIDLSDSIEINELLLITNLVITDYSSLVFEASLLKLPMIFYAYDLKEYIESRDFYFDYKRYIPGKICMDVCSVIDTIKNEDYNLEKVIQFRDIFFDDLDGKSSQRVVKLLYKALES